MGMPEPSRFPPVARLERLDHIEEFGGQRNIVEPVEQASSAQRMNAEGMLAARAVDPALPFQIHRDLGADLGMQLRPYGRACFGVEHDRYDTVLEAVVEEDVAEARRDDRPDPEHRNRIDGALARGAAAEIPLRDKNSGAPIARLIENEIGLLGTIGIEAQ